MTENDDGGSKPEEDPVPRHETAVHQWWPPIRAAVEVIGIAAELRQNVALAVATRAIVLVGDVGFQLRRR